MRYIALLRGINVGGNNKVSMAELKACFEQAGFEDVSTYINSGNVIFSSSEKNVSKLISRCESAIKTQFGFIVVVMVISANTFKKTLDEAPSWWASGESKRYRNDALFIIPPATSEQVLSEILKKTATVDQLEYRDQVIFWTLPMEKYNKSVVPKSSECQSTKTLQSEVVRLRKNSTI